MTDKTDVVENDVDTNVEEPTTVTSTKKDKKPATATATVKNEGPSKKALAQAIFDENYPKVQTGELARKDIISMFTEISHASGPMTSAYASTAYQSMKKAADAS